MTDNRHRRPLRPRTPALQEHSNDLVNGQHAGTSLAFVGSPGREYLNLEQADPGLAQTLGGDDGGSAVSSGGGGGAPAPVTSSPSKPPAPVTTQPVQSGPSTGTGATFGVPPSSVVQPDPGTTPAPVLTQPSAPAAPAVPPEPPIANAGPDQVIQLPQSSVTLDGSGSQDPQESQLTFVWGMDSGPNYAQITNGSTVNPIISGLVAGTYIFKLYLWNALGQQSTSTVSVTVKNADGSMPAAPAAGAPTAPAAPTATATAATVDISTAPVGGDSGSGPYGGAGGGGSTDAGGQGSAAPSIWDHILAFSKENWPWLLLAAAAATYLIFSKDKKP